MSIKIMSHVWQNSPVGGGELLALLALADSADDKGFTWPSIPVLARKCRLSERQVQRVIQSLEKRGAVEIERTAGGNNARHRFRVIIDKAPNPDNLSPLAQHSAVTSMTPSGDAHVTVAVTPMSPALIRNKSLRKPKGKSACVLPDWLPDQLWTDFKSHRRAVGKKLTSQAEDLAVKKLSELRSQGEDPRAVIEQSILNGWQGLFPVKRNQFASGMNGAAQPASRLLPDL